MLVWLKISGDLWDRCWIVVLYMAFHVFNLSYNCFSQDFCPARRAKAIILGRPVAVSENPNPKRKISGI